MIGDKRHSRRTRLLAILLCLLMAVSLLPAGTFATANDDEPAAEVTDDPVATADVLPEELPEEEPAEELPEEEPAEELPEEEPVEELPEEESGPVSDPTADVESAAYWESTLPGLTGDWSADVVAVAQSQLGYQESTRNFVVDEDGSIRGYTRYGAWYGDAYGDWCAMFVSFCLHYAGVNETEFPLAASCPLWAATLSGLGVYRPASEYTPQPGDVVFFDTNGNGVAGHVGIVTSVTEDALTTIEGNSAERVQYVSYALTSAAIMGYGALPEEPQTVADAAEPPATLEAEPSSASPAFDVVWERGSESSVIDGNTITVTPADNSYSTSVTAMVSFSCDGSTEYPAGAIEIRLPTSLFEYRDGNAVERYEMGIPLAPSTNEDSSFNYYVDEENHEIVITNYKTINSATGFHTEVSYFFQPSYVIDMASHTMTARATVLENGAAVTIDTASLTAVVDTDVAIESVTKYAGSKYEKWQSRWGTQPEDFSDSDYIFLEHVVRVSISGGISGGVTQAFTLALTEEPQNGGQVVSWSVWPAIYSYTQGDAASLHTDGTVRDESPYISTDPYDCWVVVAYPRAGLGTEATVTNNVTATITGFDGATDTASASSSYTYRAPVFDYDGDSFIVRSNISGGELALDCIENGLPYAGDRMQLSCFSRGYNLTLQDGEYGVNSYTTELIDDQIYLEGELLEPGDYSFTDMRMGLFEYQLIIDEDYGQYTLKKLDTPTSVLKLYYRTDAAGEWVYCQDVTSHYTMGSQYEPVSLPADAYQFKLVCTGAVYRVELYAEGSIKLNPTDHVKELTAGKTTATLTNVDSLRVLDSAGSIVNATDSSTITDDPTITDTLRQQIMAHDEAGGYGLPEGKYLEHGSGSAQLTGVVQTAGKRKTAGTPRNDTAGSRVTIDYTLFETSGFIFYQGWDDAQAAVDELTALGVDVAHNEGTFYDLLPAGMYLDADSVVLQRVFYYTPGDNYYASVDSTCDPGVYTVTQVENWRSSGRTMVVVSINDPSLTLKSGEAGWYDTSTWFSSGYQLKFTGVYPWTSISDFGASPQNLAAFMSEDIVWSNGKPDDGSDTVIPADLTDLFCDLDGDGNPAGATKNNTVYMSSTSDIQAVTSAQSGYRKAVKASTDSAFSSETTEMTGAEYSYRLRYEAEEGSSAKGIVMYDVLEEAFGDNAHWKGALVSVDVSQPVGKGVAPKIYYSTVSGLSPKTNAAQANLSDTDIWSLWTAQSPPADIGAVTALAFDLSTAADGSEYILTGKQALACYVYMRAPSDATGLTTPAVYAWNESSVSSSTKTETSSWSDPAMLVTSATKVALFQPMGTTSICGTKTLLSNGEAQTVAVGQFTFHIAADAGNNTGGYTGYADKDASVTADGTFSFGDITFTQPGVYKFTVTENDLNAPGVNYDGRSYLVTVTATTNTLTRRLDLSVEYSVGEDMADGIVFENTMLAVLFSFTKVDGGGNPLAGAQFALYRCTSEETGHIHGTPGETGSCWEAVSTCASAETTGLVELGDLQNGVYALVETQAPDGYQLPKGYWLLTVDAAAGTVTPTAVGQPPAFYTDDGGYFLPNYPKTELPVSGGFGATAFAFGGVLLLGAALLIALLPSKKKKVVHLVL